MKEFTLANGRTALVYLEKGPETNVIVTLISTQFPNVYLSRRHSFTGGDKGVGKFTDYNLADAERYGQGAIANSGDDENPEVGP